MLSLLSDEYRGKTQGLRIGATSCDIVDVKTSTIKPSADGTGTIDIQDSQSNSLALFDPNQNDIKFTPGAKFTSGIYTDSIYSNSSGGSDEINSLAKSLNLLNTVQYYEYRSIPNIGIPFTTFAASSPLVANSLPAPSVQKSNFQFPFTTNVGGWLSGVAFGQDPVYQVTLSITGDNLTQPAVIAIASYDVVTTNKKDYIARAVMAVGNGESASVTGTWTYDPLFPTIAFVIYSPLGGSTISNAEINVTFTRLF